MKKLHIFHTLIIVFVLICFFLSFRLDNLIELFIFAFAILFTTAYLFAVVITHNKKS